MYYQEFMRDIIKNNFYQILFMNKDIIKIILSNQKTKFFLKKIFVFFCNKINNYYFDIEEFEKIMSQEKQKFEEIYQTFVLNNRSPRWKRKQIRKLQEKYYKSLCNNLKFLLKGNKLDDTRINFFLVKKRKKTKYIYFVAKDDGSKNIEWIPSKDFLFSLSPIFKKTEIEYINGDNGVNKLKENFLICPIGLDTTEQKEIVAFLLIDSDNTKFNMFHKLKIQILSTSIINQILFFYYIKKEET